MKTAGVVLDFYDDVGGTILKSVFPTADALPEFVKSAHVLSPAERDVLRDEAYALVMMNEGKLLRKFACVDPGNTLLSSLYFEKNRHLLPEEAQKVAEANLLQACERFGLVEKQKEAAAMVRRRDPMMQPVVGDDANWAERTNIHSAIPGTMGSGKVMETVGTLKTASAIVDVTGKEPPFKFEKKASKQYALKDRYSLDSYADVEKAVAFFTENYKNLDPADRHEYAMKTAARAVELGIEQSEEIHRYGSTTYAPDVDGYLVARRNMVDDADFKSLYTELIEKRAGIEPDEFVKLLAQADEVAGLHWYYDGPVADPYLSVFGGPSEREKQAMWSWQSAAGDYVSAEDLLWLARNGRATVHKHFSSDISNAFCQKPMEIFGSMPDPQKIILARLASSRFDGLPVN